MDVSKRVWFGQRGTRGWVKVLRIALAREERDELRLICRNSPVGPFGDIHYNQRNDTALGFGPRPEFQIGVEECVNDEYT